jgi:hypothetical protein
MAGRGGGALETELYESDAFTAKKMALLAKFQSDYRFQKGDELYVHQGTARQMKVRVIDVRVHIHDNGSLTRELLALKL